MKRPWRRGGRAVYGEMMNPIMRGDGDPSASRWLTGCGDEAPPVRYRTG